MKSVKLFFYILMVRIVPRSLRWRNKAAFGAECKKQNADMHYKDMNLASTSYEFLKEHCQHGLYSGNSKYLPCTFSPLGITIGQPICTVIRKMGSTPHCVLDNTSYLSGYYTLLYKRKIGSLKCTFELHFHKSRLFLFCINMYDTKGATQTQKRDFVKLLLNNSESGGFRKEKGDNGATFFVDNVNQMICGIENLFRTVFILSRPDSSSLNQLLAVKFMKPREASDSEVEKLFKKTFMQAG